ncbi:MAG: DUF1489 domain-containing protein [Acetobacteraceae bacterium]
MRLQTPALHLIKLAVGVPSLEAFEERVATRRADGMSIRTRMQPKRAEQVVATGSLYWVVAGLVGARQRVLAIEEDRYDDGSRCARIDLEPALVRVSPTRMRPFQGWRYLDPAKAPPDLVQAAADGLDRLPPEVLSALRELCLI